MDAFAVAFWRLVGASTLFALWGLATGSLGLEGADARVIAFGGILLAYHLALWVWAFDMTDYASNLLLLVVQPIMAALFGMRLGEKTSRATWFSVALAILGLGVIAGGDVALGPRALLGDAISVISGLGITLFYAITRTARRTAPLPAFMALAMGTGALSLVPLLIATHARVIGYPAHSWAWLGALVLITTVGGHGLMNYVARHVTLFTLNVVIVLEPPIGVALGWPLFGARMTAVQIAGGLILAVAVVIGLLPDWAQHREMSVAEVDGT
jgi:drug/metabolite transporter (DMT)-like permease